MGRPRNHPVSIAIRAERWARLEWSAHTAHCAQCHFAEQHGSTIHYCDDGWERAKAVSRTRNELDRERYREAHPELAGQDVLF